MRFLTFTILFFTLSISAFATQNKKTAKLRIQAPTGNIDETTIYFDQNISSTYNYQEDAQKVFSGVAGVPAIYSITTDNTLCSINGYGTLLTKAIVPLGVDVDASGTYTITAPMLNNFDATSILQLEDRSNGTYVDMRTNFYQAQMDAAEPATGRFFLHISIPVTVTSVVAGCQNNDGKLHVVADNSVIWNTVQLFDAFNNPAGSFNTITGQYDFTGLAEGDYYMAYVFGSYTTTQPYHVGGNFIVADINASKQFVSTGEQVDFSAVASNANHFEWDFGDGTMISGIAHPSLAYYEPGVYQVNLRASNSVGCLDYAQIAITVSQATAVNEISTKPASIYTQNKSLFVDLNAAENNAQLQVYNLLGQSVYNSPLTSEKSTVDLDAQQNGYYLVSVKNGDKTTTQRVFIGK